MPRLWMRPFLFLFRNNFLVQTPDHDGAGDCEKNLYGAVDNPRSDKQADAQHGHPEEGDEITAESAGRYKIEL